MNNSYSTLQIEGAILEINDRLNYGISDYIDTNALECSLEALKKQVPKFVKCPKGFQGYRNTRYYCPSCNSLTRQREDFCHTCGQAVKYPKEAYSKGTNVIELDWSEVE